VAKIAQNTVTDRPQPYQLFPLHSRREQEYMEIIVALYFFIICSVSLWKLNDDLFTSTKPYDANAPGNVFTCSSAFVRACQKKTHKSTFLFIVAVVGVFSVFFIVIVAFFIFSEFF